MKEIVLLIHSSYLENERSIWICEPESVSRTTWTLARRKLVKRSVMGKISFRLCRRSMPCCASETRYSRRAMRCAITSSTEVTTTRLGIEPWWMHSSEVCRFPSRSDNLA
jgi:hypothetical protein